MRNCQVLAALTLAVTIGGGSASRSSIPFYRSAQMNPEWLSRRVADAPTMHRVAHFEVIDQNEQRLTERAFAGHVTIAHFFFTRCGDVCPTTTTNLKRVLKSFGPQPMVQVFSYSLTPAADSVGALR